MSGNLEIARWPENCRFAYSITYDEGFVEVLGFAWRLHGDFGVPGHLNVHPDLVGRLEGDTSAGFLQSLWNLRKYAEAEHLQALIGEGWSVGCQYDGPSDTSASPAGLRMARTALEDRLGCHVASLAFSDGTTWQANASAASEAGYRWLLPLYDDLNPPEPGENVIRRSPLYHQGPPPNRLANDPYRLLARAADSRGWVVDAVRSVDRYPADPARDCTPAELERRFRAVREVGGDEVWLANVEEAARYRGQRAAARLEMSSDIGDQVTGVVRIEAGTELDDIPLTFLVRLDPGWDRPLAFAGGKPVSLQAGSKPNTWHFACPVADGMRIRILKHEMPA